MTKIECLVPWISFPGFFVCFHFRNPRAGLPVELYCDLLRDSSAELPDEFEATHARRDRFRPPRWQSHRTMALAGADERASVPKR
jgi:hypothetical protein